jgi:hypothetical protein
LLALIAFAFLLLLPTGRAEASCYDNGAGVGYRGNWYALSAADRQARCVEAERRQAEREDVQRERDAVRDERLRQREDGSRPAAGGGSSAEADRRQQECLVNADACAMPGASTGSSSGDPSTRSRRTR